MAALPIGGTESTAQVGGHPLHPMLVPFPIVFLITTLACDIMFWVSEDPFWATVAIWALGAGLATGAVAAMAGLADFLGSARIRALKDSWQHFIGNAAVLVLAFVNFYVRWSDTTVADAVFPAGILLSAVVVLVLGYTGWKGGEMVYRHGIGVASRLAGAGSAETDAPSPSHIHAQQRHRHA